MNRIKYIAGLFLLVILATGLSYPYSNLPAGGGGSGSGLPSGGTVGQLVINTAPGTGTWQDFNIPGSGSGSGLPSGGTVGQLVINTAPGTGTWQDFNIPGNGIVQGILKLGTQSPDPLESQIYSARLLNDASGLGAGNSGHGFSDYTNITRTGTIGYGSFDSMCTISGVADYDHISGFQTRNIINIPGHTLGAWYGFHASGTFTAGTTTTRYGFYNIAPTITGGTITNNYAFFNSDPLANQQFSGFTAFGINATVDPLVQVKITGTVTASHDNDTIYGLYVNPTFADGGKSGVTHVGIYNGGTLWQTGDIGFTGNRVPYGYFTNLACTNTITGTTSGNLPLTGGTIAGNLAFSGTTNWGLTHNALTTTQRDALVSPTPGAVIWNTTTKRVNLYTDTPASWVAGWVRLDGDTMTGNLVGNFSSTPGVVSGTGGGTYHPSSTGAAGGTKVSLFTITDLTGTGIFYAPIATGGTFNDGDKMTIRIYSTDATPLDFTTSTNYNPVGTVLPTTTVAHKFIYIGCVYNSRIVTTYHPAATWDVVSVSQQ